jgi:hypothetical protein
LNTFSLTVEARSKVGVGVLGESGRGKLGETGSEVGSQKEALSSWRRRLRMTGLLLLGAGQKAGEHSLAFSWDLSRYPYHT